MMHLERFVLPLLAVGLHAVSSLAAQAQQPRAPGVATSPRQAAPQQPVQPVAERAADIEGRLIDLQVRIATMRSLSSNAAPAATGAGSQSAFRSTPPPGAQQIAALEGEIRELSAQSRRLSGRPALIMPESTRARRPLPDSRTPSGVAPPPATVETSPTTTPGGAATAPGWASSTTVSPNTNQGLFEPPGQSGTTLQGELLPGTVYPGTDNAPPQAPAPQRDALARLADPAAPRQPAAAVTDGPETEYQRAYGFLLQQDYGAAQTAFREFIARHPKTPLAGNAQYWIGETHYARGAYKQAAVAFLKGYETYGDGNKGPDSLLKLALSLGKLGQKAAACTSLTELGSRYRNAPEGVLARATAEKRRLRCAS